MKYIPSLSLILTIILISFHVSGQNQAYKGYPSRHTITDLKAEFQNPPKGYGNVPFYWWEGDTLKKERLLEQLNTLSDVVDGFAVSYIHTHPGVDKEWNAKGYGSYGRATGGTPDFYSEDWWNLWNWFSGECAERGIGVGVDDYVVGWPKNGYYPDEIIDEEFASYPGRLKMVKVADLKDDLKTNEKDLKKIVYQDSTVIIFTEPSYELHPEYGKRLVDVYFGRFEDKLDDNGRNGMNYFFQDELQYNLRMNSWSEDMPQQFLQRKGYDITPYLPALFEDMGDITPKIRLDYADVLSQLADERYFKTVFDWHHDRGLIYGCDNEGRGLNPTQYIDYFHTISWFTAPGNDAPARGSSFRQTKVSSSVSHLYDRPRTWLEAFYSMGWDCNGKWLTSQLDRHIIGGGNLLCMHGLYYSTHGGWWEWAPPCFHFRMPYWNHMKHWLRYAERLCFLLSQGHHVCDIAVLYPTETLQAYPQTKIDGLWNLTDSLSRYGLDYDYIDHTSLIKNSSIEDRTLKIGNESYKVLIVPDAKAMHHQILQQIKNFSDAGGVMIFVGDLPQATTRKGANDPEISQTLQNILSKGSFHVATADEAITKIVQNIDVDFKNLNGEATVLHRRIQDKDGFKDVYMVMDASKNDVLYFHSTGNVEIWNAENGATKTKSVMFQNNDGTLLNFDGEKGQSVLYVFSPGKATPTLDKNQHDDELIVQEIEGDWTVSYIPTMDNKWGDFRLPATDEIIGVEAREITSINPINKEPLTSVYGFTPYMEYTVLDKDIDLVGIQDINDINNLIVNSGSKDSSWRPYVYSWQYGVFDNPGSQGYHGLKGKVDNRFIILDKPGHMIFRTKVLAPAEGKYQIVKEGIEPTVCLIDNEVCNGSVIDLSKGWHELVLVYANTREDPAPSYDIKSNYVDNRDRSAVVFYPVDSNVPTPRPTTDNIVATKWFGSDHLTYNPYADKTKWKHQFETAPGATDLTLVVDGTIDKLTVDGVKQKLTQTSDGHYQCQISQPSTDVSKVVVESTNNPSSPGQAFFKEPVRISCGEGRLPLDNWSEYGALKYYSGGMVYKKTVNIDTAGAKAIQLDLGEVDATCEISVNGSEPIIGICPPFKFDITDLVKNGENQIQVTVYSSLSNHYQTIPSKYRGEPHSGLFGPVQVLIHK